ncbi:MAG: hypothetical protein J2P50_04145 [Hyphomicrobiaceae bacterium]|nr:hypothetical protein [Hyphomicrobiaceae bacterium]
MTIRQRLAFTVAVTSALAACGLPAAGNAADPDGATRPKADMRDLRPAPSKTEVPVERPLVTLRPSASVVPVGTPVGFEVYSSINGFGHIYVLSASGRVQVWMENVPIAAGQRLTFPIGGPPIEAAAPAGREDLMLIVTRDRIDGFIGYAATRTPHLLDYSHRTFKRALTAKFIDLPHHQWGYARTSIQVVERSPSAPSWGWATGGPQRPTDLWAGQWETD